MSRGLGDVYKRQYMVFTYSCFNQMIVKQVEEKKRFAASSDPSYNLYEIV